MLRDSIFCLLMQSNFLFLPIKKIEKPTLSIEETLMLLDFQVRDCWLIALPLSYVEIFYSTNHVKWKSS